MTRGRPPKSGDLSIYGPIKPENWTRLENVVKGRPRLKIEYACQKKKNGTVYWKYGYNCGGANAFGGGGPAKSEKYAVDVLTDQGPRYDQAYPPKAKPPKPPAKKKPSARAAKKSAPKKPQKKSDKLTPPGPVPVPVPATNNWTDPRAATADLTQVLQAIRPGTKNTVRGWELGELDNVGRPIWRGEIRGTAIALRTILKFQKHTRIRDVDISAAGTEIVVSFDFDPESVGTTVSTRGPGRPPIRHRDPPPDQSRLTDFKKAIRRPRSAPRRVSRTRPRPV